MVEGNFTKAAQVSEINSGDMKLVEVGGEQVLLVNVGGTIHACDDICSHSYASLSEGDLSGAEIECPLHGAMFNVATGQALTPPAEIALRTFEVKIEGDDILIAVP